MNIERYILGACFHSHAVVDILQSVSADDFSAKEDQHLFSVIERLVASGIDPDLPTIAAADKTLSASYIAEIEMECVAVGNLGYMLNQFRDHADRLRFMRLGNYLTRDQDQTATELRVEIERALETKIDSKTEHISKPLKRALAQMENAYNNRGKITGIPTGITKIDDELSGLHKTDMILIASRPSIGKTALALQIADSACINGGEPTLFISLEMSSEQLSSRLLLSRSKINVSKARNGLFDEVDWSRMTESAGRMNDAPLYVDDCAGITMDQLMAKAKAAKMKNNIGLLIIDYLGLIGGSGTEYERVSDASRKTKILAKQLNIPAVAVHQLNRGGEKDGKTRRPTMSDLRGTGQLEQDADVIILAHREKKNPIESCELIIEKNRHGKTGIIPQQWNGPINRIENIGGQRESENHY